MRTKAQGPLLLFLFLISGACGLIYEIAWTRLLTVIIGNTVFSVSTILVVFMAGLALGSRLSGRFLDRKPISLTRAYALLEAGIAAYNLILPVLLEGADPVFAIVYAAFYQAPVLLGLARLAISFALLILPAMLMGATLPLLIRFYVAGIAQTGWQTGRVYAVNTCGAALGAAAAGFLIIPRAGVTFALYFAAALNLAIAVVSWNIPGRSEEASSPVWSGQKGERGPRIVLAAMFFSGLSALANEVAWTRVLSLVVGPTTYAFTLMLCSMIAGLGAGAAFSSWWIKRREISLGTFAWLQAALAIASLALVPAFGEMPLWIGRLVAGRPGSFAEIQVLELLIFFALLLAPTTLLGMTFPVACRLYAKSDISLGTDVTSIYALNTVGGIVGSLLAGFALIPAIGTQATLEAAAVICALNAAALMQNSSLEKHSKSGLFVMAAVVAAVFVIPKWNPELMTSGAYKYAPLYSSNTDLESMLTRGDIIFIKEGAASTVSVRKLATTVMLAIDGKIDATDAGDMTTQKMLAHLPLLISRDAKNVAIIGLGSGVTAGAALKHPIQKLDVVEISPEVVEASRFFSHVNEKPLEDSRTELILGDGRNHLRYGGRQYDVIISEPSNPWMAGMASLFTREFFAEARSRLAEGGIHCQWFHSYNMSMDDVRTIVATFRTEFPHAMLLTLNNYDLYLIGSTSPIQINETLFEENFRRVASDLKSIRVQHPYSILSSLILRDAELDDVARRAVLNTDDLPVLEFHAPRAIHADTTATNLTALRSVPRTAAFIPYVRKLIENPTPERHRHKGEMLFAAEAFDDARVEFQAAIALAPGDAAAGTGLVETYLRLDERTKAFEVLDQMAAADPDNVDVLAKMADVAADLGNPRLEQITNRLRAIAPDNATGLYHLASLYLYRGRFDEAIQTAKLCLENDPGNVRARNVLAVAYERTFQPELSEAEFRRAIRESPDDLVSLNNYGIYLLGRNRPSEARGQFLSAISVRPDNVPAFVGMGEAFREEGAAKEAERWYRKALRMDPNNAIAKQYVK